VRQPGQEWSSRPELAVKLVWCALQPEELRAIELSDMSRLEDELRCGDVE